MSPSHAGASAKHGSGFWRHLGLGLLVTFLLVGAKVCFEHTTRGHHLEQWTYNLLHSHLPYFDRAEELPVVIVDISKIQGGRGDAPTPRGDLKRLLTAIAAEKPSAIAIDVDFSPDGKGWITDDDPEFFDYCLELADETGVPVLLGIFRTKASPPDTWLGLPKFSRLAVALMAREGDVSRAPRWVQLEGGDRLRALSWAIASAHEPALPPTNQCNSLVFECSEDRLPGTDSRPNEHLTVSDFLVNYSKLEELKRETLLTGSEQSVREFGERFRHRMVILGDALEFTDPFVVPGHEQPVAGVYVHASAAYTLVQGALREFNHGFRIFLDVAISIFISASLFFARGGQKGSRRWRARSWILVSAVAVVLAAGVLLVRWYNVMWLDFLLVGFALLLHPKVEGWFETFMHGRKGDKLKPDPGRGS
jgi:CHASE2 domain-containing sensor protein